MQKHIAVISKDEPDFLNHVKDIDNIYTQVSRKQKRIDNRKKEKNS